MVISNKIIQVRIGQRLIGLRGLEEIFGKLQGETWGSEAEAQEELLRRVEWQNYLPRSSREEYRLPLWREFARFRGAELAPETPAVPEIKVLGLGCAGCRAFYQQVLNILASARIEADLQYLTDPALLQNYRVRTFPALIVNGRLLLEGRLPPPQELERLLLAALRDGSDAEGC